MGTLTDKPDVLEARVAGGVTAGHAPVLACRDIAVTFDGINALDGVGLSLAQGDVLGLIGTNGAGKTTLVNVISGYQPVSRGAVTLGERDITGLSPGRLARAGIVRTFQSGRVFPALTVAETLEVAGVGGGLSRRKAREQGARLLRHSGLAGLDAMSAAALPHGQVRVLGILRALATRPSFILVDEPAAGSNESESEQILELLEWIARECFVGLLVIEHDMSLIMRLCPRIQVLDHGRTIGLGSPAEVRSDPEVIRAYLGTGGDADAAG